MSENNQTRKKKPALKMKSIVILVYLNEKGANYNYKDLKDLVSLEFQDLDGIIQELKEKDYVKYTKSGGYEISEKGENLLKIYDLTNFKIEEYLEKKEEFFVSMNPDFSEVYIPRDFDSKV